MSLCHHLHGESKRNKTRRVWQGCQLSLRICMASKKKKKRKIGDQAPHVPADLE